ncbi:hypothetical protein N0Y54_29465 [Nostoc punctiforme UO1]|uniref:hypothetical protein n=1 Tax=Nostoc punctiforme TaxID=272131 RepID=UPI00309C276F
MLARNWRESGLDLSSLTIASPVSFGEEDTELVELASAPEDEDKYSFVRTSSAPADLMDRPGMVIREWENMDFYERIQADPTYIDRI